MDQHADMHSAAVILKTGSLSGGHPATWINVFEATHGDEECFFLLPDGNVVTGPEWCEHLSLSEELQQQWQQLISVPTSSGVVPEWTSIAKALSQVVTHILPPQPPPAGHVIAQHCSLTAARPVVVQQPSRATGNKELSGYHLVDGNIANKQPVAGTSSAAGGALDQEHGICMQSGEVTESLCPSRHESGRPIPWQNNTHARTTRDARADWQQLSAAIAPGISKPVQLSGDAGDVGRRQHAVSQSVRVTLTNYDTHETVYASWINADEVLQGAQASFSAATMFLHCTDETYQPTSGKPENAASLAKQCNGLNASNAMYRIRLNQRFKAATGHCFYAGMSLAQVKCLVSSNKAVSQFIFGQEWDADSVDATLIYDAAEQIHVRVMTVNTKSAHAIYAQAELTQRPYNREPAMFAMCDKYYNIIQPNQLLTLSQFIGQAGLSWSRQVMFITQRLQLPSGSVLLPGTFIHQVIEEVHKLNNPGDGLQISQNGVYEEGIFNPSQNTSMDIVSNSCHGQPSVPMPLPLPPQRPNTLHFPIQPQTLTKADDVGRWQHGVGPSVRVTLTNYDTHETVYALWINADDVVQHAQQGWTTGFFGSGFAPDTV